jgi:hypothetical protein
MTKLAWRIVGTMVAVPMLLFGGCNTALALAHSQRTVTLSVPLEGITAVDVGNNAGSVRIVGVRNAGEITVRGRIDDGWRDTGHSVTTEGGVLQVRGSCPDFGSNFCHVRYTIEVPTTMPVSVHAEGTIDVTDMAAGLVASTSDSTLTLERVDGDLDLQASQGRILASDIRSDTVLARANEGHISLVFAESPTSVTAQADQGSIEIVLPDDTVAYATTLSANQGNVTDVVDRDLDSPRTIVAHASEGDITLTYASS